jgi:hypothetical protein
MPLYFSFVRIYAPFLGILTLVGIALGVVFTSLQPQTYDVSLELDIERIQTPNDEYYQYDGFYAIRATNKFAKVVKGWFQTPSFVISVLNESNRPTENLEVSELRNQFTSEKISSNTVEVRWSATSRQKARATTQAMANTIQSKLDASEQKDRSRFTIQTSEPVIKRHEYNPLFFGGAGAALGLFVGLIGALGYEIRNRNV